MAGPTSRPFLKAFACAAVAFIVPIVAVLIAWGPPAGNGAANLLGQLFALTFIPAIITGFIARRAKTAWSTMKIVVIYILILVVAVILLAAGKVRPHPP
jgi:hypothetical protein